jgi:hypothetical protein
MLSRWLVLAFVALLAGRAVAAPRLDDGALLDDVQRRTLDYFVGLAHPQAGLAPERNTTPDTLATGGSGMGAMALLAGVERGWVARPAAVALLAKMLAFLERADRFHGAFPHWLDGRTGHVIPFSDKDDGADLVETAYLMQGLLAVRQWCDRARPEEAALAGAVDRLWRGVEWSWFTRGENVLYWHWSPKHGWAMNMPIRGWNEALIVYVLAAASPTHPVAASVYHRGWASGGAMESGHTYEGIALPLGMPWGGPLFFAHYSFLGLDPRGLSDRYGDYFAQNRAHAQINFRYCVRNPGHHQGYGPAAWGLTASDSFEGYSAHSPTNDLGVISPTAAASSLPYTPAESLAAIRHFHDDLGARLFGPHGFYDAYCPDRGWFATTTLAIDQGPIVVMIENHRSGLLWRLFMSAPEIAPALAKLGFHRR